ncbi:PIH1 domain-containing protein 1, partial [Clonorchis sinensis]
MPHRPSRGAISRVALLAAYSRAGVRKKRTPRLAIEKLVDPEVKRNYQNQLVECLPDGTVSDINGHWEKISKALLKVGTSVCGTTQPTSFKHWISDRTVSLLETRRQIPPGRHHNSTRRIIRRQVKLSVRADREAWWTRKAQEMEDAKNAGNVRRLFHLIRSTGPRKPLVSETIRDQNGSLICNKAERLDRWAQYFEQQFSWPPATSNQETWPSTESWTILDAAVVFLASVRPGDFDDIQCSFNRIGRIPQYLTKFHTNPTLPLAISDYAVTDKVNLQVVHFNRYASLRYITYYNILKVLSITWIFSTSSVRNSVYEVVRRSQFSGFISALQTITQQILHKPLTSSQRFGFVEARSGNGCTAYDVIVHPNLLKKVQSSELFEAFLMTVIFEGLENKYNVQLERTWVVLKNKRAMGRLQEQYVRAAPRPTIVEMGDTSGQVGDVPPYELLAVPEEGIPEYLVARITLPKLRSALLNVSYEYSTSHVLVGNTFLWVFTNQEALRGRQRCPERIVRGTWGRHLKSYIQYFRTLLIRLLKILRQPTIDSSLLGFCQFEAFWPVAMRIEGMKPANRVGWSVLEFQSYRISLVRLVLVRPKGTKQHGLTFFMTSFPTTIVIGDEFVIDSSIVFTLSWMWYRKSAEAHRTVEELTGLRIVEVGW